MAKISSHVMHIVNPTKISSEIVNQMKDEPLAQLVESIVTLLTSSSSDVQSTVSSTPFETKTSEAKDIPSIQSQASSNIASTVSSKAQVDETLQETAETKASEAEEVQSIQSQATETENSATHFYRPVTPVSTVESDSASEESANNGLICKLIILILVHSVVVCKT